MKRSFIAIILLINLALSFATTEQENILQGRKLFRKLNNHSDIGRNIVETIQLELETNEDQTVVSKVISLVREVQQSLLEQRDGFQGEVDEKNEQCFSQVTDLREEIKTLGTRIEEQEDKVPLREDEVKLLEEEAGVKQETLTFYQQEVIAMDKKNTAKKESYEQSLEESNNLIAALQQAKSLIRSLKNQNSFLEKKGQVMAQVSNHFQNVLQFIQTPKNKAFLKYLIQVSQVADQDQVDSILEILDDLISSTQETQEVERKAESRRKSLYDTKRASAISKMDNAQAELNTVQGQVKTAQKRLSEIKGSLQANIDTQNAKQQQLDDHLQACSDQVAALNSRIENFDEILDLIRQLLLLLENSSIQGVKTMVSDLDKEEEDKLIDSIDKDGNEVSSKKEESSDATADGKGASSDSSADASADASTASSFTQKRKFTLLRYDPLDN